MKRLACALVIGTSVLAATAVGVAQQSDSSRKALESAAAKGSAPAQYALGAADEADGDFARALEWYQRAADQNYAAAQLKIGQLYENGNGVDADKAQAIEWYRKASAQGLVLATERLRALDPTTAATPTPTTPPPIAPPATEPPLPTAPVEQPSAVTPTNAPSSVASPVSVASAVRTPDTGSETKATSSSEPGTLFWGFTVVEGVMLWLGIRSLIMAWYRSGTWVYSSGKDGAGVLGAQIGNRLRYEKMSVFLGFGIAFLTNFILWMWWNGKFN